MNKQIIPFLILILIVFTSCFKVHETSEEECRESVIDFANTISLKAHYTEDLIPLEISSSSNIHYRQKYMHIGVDSLEGQHMFSCFAPKTSNYNAHEISVLIKYLLHDSDIQYYNGLGGFITKNTFWQLKYPNTSAILLKENIKSITITSSHRADSQEIKYYRTIDDQDNLQKIFQTTNIGCGVRLSLKLDSVMLKNDSKEEAELRNISMKAIVN